MIALNLAMTLGVALSPKNQPNLKPGTDDRYILGDKTAAVVEKNAFRYSPAVNDLPKTSQKKHRCLRLADRCSEHEAAGIVDESDDDAPTGFRTRAEFLAVAKIHLHAVSILKTVHILIFDTFGRKDREVEPTRRAPNRYPRHGSIHGDDAKHAGLADDLWYGGIRIFSFGYDQMLLEISGQHLRGFARSTGFARQE